MSLNFAYCFYIHNSITTDTVSLSFYSKFYFLELPFTLHAERSVFIALLPKALYWTVMTESSAWPVTDVEALRHSALEILSIYTQTQLQKSLLQVLLATNCWLFCAHAWIRLDIRSRFYL